MPGANSIKCSGSVFKLDGKQFINSPSDGGEVIIRVPQDGGTESDYIEVPLTEGSDLSFMIDVFLGYKVK